MNVLIKREKNKPACSSEREKGRMKSNSNRLSSFIYYISLMICMIPYIHSEAKTNYTKELRSAISNSHSATELINRVKAIHHTAYENGDAVVYPRRKTFYIEILQDFQPIKLTNNTNFNGCTFIVKNTCKNTFLFELSNNDAPHDIFVEKQKLQLGENIPAMKDNPKLLIVKDNNLWTTRYDFDTNGNISNIKQKCYRYDLMFVDNGIIANNPIATYNNTVSFPSCQFINVDLSKKDISNINLIREATSTAITNLFHIEYQYNVRISNVNVRTNLTQREKDRIYNDQCIKVDHSAKIEMKDITVSHTYSSQTIWGYAIEMNNILDCSFENLDITAIRGGFNTTCANNLRFNNCQLNRADVHYYGKDMTCENCTFRNTVNDFHVYNRFSSFYGKLIYRNCMFDGFLPVRIDSEYNAFTPFDIEMTDCTLRVIYQGPSRYNCICHIPILESLQNMRPELKDKYLPNLTIKGLQIECPSGVKDFYYYLISKDKCLGTTKGIETLYIDDISYSVVSEDVLSFHDCNIQMAAKPKKRIVTPAINRR